MSEVRIAAEHRTEFGKGAARRIRQNHRVPAVMYGHGEEQRHITLPGHELMLALKTPNALLSVDVDGKPQLAIAKEVQRDVLKGWLEHVDLQVVRRGEMVTVNVAVVLEGDTAPGTVLMQDLNEISLSADATAIPQTLVIDVTGREAGQHLTAGEIELPQGATLLTDPEALIASLGAAQSAEAAEAEIAAAEADLGIVHDEKSEEGEAGATEESQPES